MKKIVLCIAIAALAACGGHEESASQAQAASEPEARAEQKPEQNLVPAPGKPVPAPEGQRGAEALAAAGVAFDFPHEVLYDILDVSAGGTPRHRVLVEIGGGDFQDATERFGQTLQGLGYELASDKKSGGRMDRTYTAEGKPTYYVIMQPSGMGPELRGKDSSGSIHIMWNIPKDAI